MEGRCVVQNEAELQLKRKSTLYTIEENFIKSNNDTEKCPPGSKDYNRLVSLYNLLISKQSLDSQLLIVRILLILSIRDMVDDGGTDDLAIKPYIRHKSLLQ